MSYLAQSSLEWKMFQTKVAEKFKTHISRSIWDNVEKYCRGEQATVGIRRMRFACSITRATQYEILIAFPLQQWLIKHANILRYTYISSLAKCYILGSLDARNYVAGMWENKRFGGAT